MPKRKRRPHEADGDDVTGPETHKCGRSADDPILVVQAYNLAFENRTFFDAPSFELDWAENKPLLEEIKLKRRYVHPGEVVRSVIIRAPGLCQKEDAFAGLSALETKRKHA